MEMGKMASVDNNDSVLHSIGSWGKVALSV